jgi:hypothetical protein
VDSRVQRVGFFKQTFDGDGEINAIERLPDEAIYPSLHGLMLRFFVSMSSDNENGHIGEHGFDLTDKGQTVNPWHIEIGDDQMIMAGLHKD